LIKTRQKYIKGREERPRRHTTVIDARNSVAHSKERNFVGSVVSNQDSLGDLMLSESRKRSPKIKHLAKVTITGHHSSFVSKTNTPCRVNKVVNKKKQPPKDLKEGSSPQSLIGALAEEL